MLRNRVFNQLLAVALVLAIVLTVRDAFATSAIISQPDAAVACGSLPSRHSMHPEYVKESGIPMLYTEDGPVGVDGGLRELMSAYRSCSR